MTVNASLSEQAAELIRGWTYRRNLNKSELARRLGVSHTWVTNRLAGHQEISLNELERFAEILGVDVADLLPAPAGRDDQPPRPIRTAYPDSSERPAPHAPDVRSRPVPAGRSSDAGSRSKRAFWTHA